MRLIRPLLACSLLVCLSCFVFVPGSAGADSPVRIGYVDLQRALASSKAGAKAQKSYEAEVKLAQAGIDKKKEQFQQKKTAFEKQRESLNEKALIDRQEELLQIERDVQRSFKDEQEKLRRKNTAIVSELITELRSVVDKIGQEGGYTVIVEKGSQAVLYVDKAIDITDRVVKEFDQRQK